MEKRYIIALKIGSSKIKGAIASMPFDGANSPITIEAIHEAPTPVAAVQHGRIQNIAETAKTASSIIQQLESRRIFAPGKIVATYTSIGGRSLASENIRAEIEFPQEAEITDEFITRLKNTACAQIDNAREILEVIPVKYMVDSVELANPVGAFGRRLSGSFTAVTCNPINKRNLEMVVEDRLKLDICENIICPLAEAELVLTGDERQVGCVFIDLGAETTTVAIYKNSVLQSIATLPIGARSITRDISLGVGITEERAEQIKCTIGNAIDEAPMNVPGSDEAKANNYVRARIGEIIANIKAQISAADFKFEDIPGGFVVIGGGARLRNFNTLLESETKLKVRTGTCGSNFRIADNSIDHYDNIDILSIVNHAAITSDYVCIEMPYEAQAADMPQIATPAAPQRQRTAPAYDDVLIDDDDVLIDDDELDRRKEKEARAAKEKPQTIKGDAELADDGDDEKPTDQPHGTDRGKPSEQMSRVQKLKDTIIRIFTIEEDKDAELDDMPEPNNKKSKK